MVFSPVTDILHNLQQALLIFLTLTYQYAINLRQTARERDKTGV